MYQINIDSVCITWNVAKAQGSVDQCTKKIDFLWNFIWTLSNCSREKTTSGGGLIAGVRKVTSLHGLIYGLYSTITIYTQALPPPPLFPW